MSNATYIASLRPGSRVTYLVPSGQGRNGIEYRSKTSKVVLAMGTHVVVNMGGRHGTPFVVTPENVVR